MKSLWKIFGPNAEGSSARRTFQLSRKEPGCRPRAATSSASAMSPSMSRRGGLRRHGPVRVREVDLVRLITRLIEPTSGEVILDGQDITRLSDPRCGRSGNKVSMVFQHFGLLPHRKVIDNIAFGLEVRGEGKDSRRNRAQEMVDLVGLSGYERNFPSSRRHAAAGRAGRRCRRPGGADVRRALSALDPPIRRDMQNEVIRLHHEAGKTMVFITHDLQEALKLGDRILIMRDGAVIQIGRRTRSSAPLPTRYVRDFVSEVPKSHVLTLRWVMREATGTEAAGSPVLQASTIVRDAARAVLATHGPVRVAEGDRVVGIVDDEDILRVVVAEDAS